MSSYVKLFSSILQSTIWQEDSDTRLIWITLLALKNKHGIVRSSVPGLAHTARVDLQKTESALAKLAEPDKYSSSPDFEGRRIEIIDGGWHILNSDKYRCLMSKDERLEYQREWDREKRKRPKRNPTVIRQEPTKPTHTDQIRSDIDKTDAGVPLSCEEPKTASASSPSVQMILEYPITGNARSRTWNLTQIKFDEWKSAFPGRDVLKDCREARQWLLDNPSRQKTAKGMTRFLGSWIQRANDRGSVLSNGHNFTARRSQAAATDAGFAADAATIRVERGSDKIRAVSLLPDIPPGGVPY